MGEELSVEWTPCDFGMYVCMYVCTLLWVMVCLPYLYWTEVFDTYAYEVWWCIWWRMAEESVEVFQTNSCIVSCFVSGNKYWKMEVIVGQLSNQWGGEGKEKALSHFQILYVEYKYTGRVSLTAPAVWYVSYLLANPTLAISVIEFWNEQYHT